MRRTCCGVQLGFPWQTNAEPACAEIKREPEVTVIRSNHSSSRERKWVRISMTGRKNPVEKIGKFHHDLCMRRLICVVAVSVPVA